MKRYCLESLDLGKFKFASRVCEEWNRLTMDGHGWPSAGEKSKCLKIPPHVPQVMIKLSLKSIH